MTRANAATTIIMILVSLPATGCATAGVYTTHRSELSGSVLASLARYPNVVAYDDGTFGVGGNSNVLVSTAAQVSYSRRLFDLKARPNRPGPMGVYIETPLSITPRVKRFEAPDPPPFSAIYFTPPNGGSISRPRFGSSSSGSAEVSLATTKIVAASIYLEPPGRGTPRSVGRPCSLHARASGLR